MTAPASTPLAVFAHAHHRDRRVAGAPRNASIHGRRADILAPPRKARTRSATATACDSSATWRQHARAARRPHGRSRTFRTARRKGRLLQHAEQLLSYVTQRSHFGHNGVFTARPAHVARLSSTAHRCLCVVHGKRRREHHRHRPACDGEGLRAQPRHPEHCDHGLRGRPRRVHPDLRLARRPLQRAPCSARRSASSSSVR